MGYVYGYIKTLHQRHPKPIVLQKVGLSSYEKQFDQLSVLQDGKAALSPPPRLPYSQPNNVFARRSFLQEFRQADELNSVSLEFWEFGFQRGDEVFTAVVADGDGVSVSQC